ncbi:MAG: helix-turn-helix domain-containing protein [Eubacteriales bacterium]|nr:helix-turn-helix domain-containing protein [Eubacteriales bacterium]
MELGKNIRAGRKKMGLTQEELAEKMNVSVGAVSKWESGASTPELSLLMRLALCFQTSLDALTGFDLENQKSKEACLEQIRQLTRDKAYEEGKEQVVEILATYPNDFQVNLDSARFYHLNGVEQKDRDALKRAIALYRKSILLLEQNQNPHINQAVLEDLTAQLMIELGEYEEAIVILKKNNIYNVNDYLIAQTMVRYLDQSEEALPLLSQELYLLISKLFALSIAFARAYQCLGRYEEALDILHRTWPLPASFIDREHVSIFDKMEVIYRTMEAMDFYGLGQLDKCEEALRLAKQAALRFDNCPNFDLTGFPHFYLEENYYIYDDFGRDSLEAIGSSLKEFPAEEVYEIWERIQEEDHEEGK